MKQKKNILIYLLYWLLYGSLISTYIFHHELFMLVPDTLIFYLAFIGCNRKTKELKKYIGKGIPLLLSILLLGSTLVAILNMMPFISIVWGLRMIVRYILMFIFIFNTFDSCDVIKVKKILFRAYWVNATIMLYQYFAQKLYADLMGGIQRGNGSLFVFSLICVLLFSVEFFQGRMSKQKFAIVLVFQMFAAMAAEIKMMYFTIPLAIYGVYVLVKKFSIRHIVILVAAYFFLIPGMQAVISLMYGQEYVERTFDMDYIEDETSHVYSFGADRDIGFNRSTALEKASLVILQNDPIHIATGYGMGSGNTSQMFQTWIGATYGELTSYNFFSTSYILVEFGWIGLILLVFLFLMFIRVIYRFYSLSSDPVVKEWASIGIMLSALIFLLGWYCNIPVYDGCLYYYMIALCFVGIKLA